MDISAQRLAKAEELAQAEREATTFDVETRRWLEIRNAKGVEMREHLIGLRAQLALLESMEGVGNG